MKYNNVKVEATNTVGAHLSLFIQESYPEVYGVRKRPMVLVVPGGAYEYVSPREGEPIAFNFMTAGCHSAILWYDVAGDKVEFPQSLKELAWSVAYIREHADEYSIDKDKIVVAGFSAGAHLAASLGCFWDKEWLEKDMGIDKEQYRPNGLMLAYPVITSGEFAHRGSIVNLMGSKASDELNDFLSLENQVTDKVPPVFMWHTFEDEAVPLENSIMFAQALRKAGVNFEYHVFPHGGHGYSLATKETVSLGWDATDPQCEQWMGLCKNWIKYNF